MVFAEGNTTFHALSLVPWQFILCFLFGGTIGCTLFCGFLGCFRRGLLGAFLIFGPEGKLGDSIKFCRQCLQCLGLGVNGGCDIPDRCVEGSFTPASLRLARVSACSPVALRFC